MEQDFWVWKRIITRTYDALQAFFAWIFFILKVQRTANTSSVNIFMNATFFETATFWNPLCFFILYFFAVIFISCYFELIYYDCRYCNLLLIYILRLQNLDIIVAASQVTSPFHVLATSFRLIRNWKGSQHFFGKKIMPLFFHQQNLNKCLDFHLSSQHNSECVPGWDDL